MPLKGVPLTALNLTDCSQIEDLSPLDGMKLTQLDLYGCSKIQNLAPLRGMKLTSLRLNNCRQVNDLTPLEGMTLEWIILPPTVSKGLDVVRKMSSLKTIDGKPAAQFWKEWDAAKSK